ncbi:putative transposase [Arthrobacter sp. B3I4]|nr:putative transposase [Arthrobacter sp. B3I4]
MAALMRQEGCICRIRRRKYNSHRGEIGHVAPNRLARDFQADAPHLKWVTDVTEFRVADQKMYLSPVLDLFNGEIIAHAVRPSPALPLVMDMLTDAFKVLKPGEHPVLHQSMSRKANCYDNAAMESFFGHLKEEFFHHDRFDTIEQFEQGLSQYIHWYNHTRIKEKLKGLSPVQYRTQSLHVA